MKRIYNSSDNTKESLSDKIKKLTLNQMLGAAFCFILFIFTITGIVYIVTLNNVNAYGNDEMQNYIVENETTSTEKNTETNIDNKIEITSKYTGPQLYENDIIDATNIQTNLQLNGKITNLDTNDVTLSKNAYLPLSLGDNKITVTYKTESQTIMITTLEKNNVAKAIELFSDEFSKADYTHVTENTYITITKYTNPDVYWLAHVVVNDPSQVTVAMANDEFGTRESSLSNQKLLGWTLGINGSYFDNANQSIDGIYINNNTIYQSTENNIAMGYELCMTQDGKLFTADVDTTLETLEKSKVINTVVSNTPTIINNNTAIDITETSRSPKTAIGQVSSTEYYMLVASDGDYFCDMTYGDIQNVMLEHNCTYAKILDGSTNTSMVMNQTTINEPACGPGRQLKDLVVVYDKP